MNKLNFNQSIGFPLETEILDEMQKAYTIFNALGNLAGNFTIISGCVTAGSSVGNGFVFINDELLPFVGGTITPNVIIVETIETREFEDNNERDVITRRHATFGTATIQWPWANFIRGVQTKDIATIVSNLIGRIEELEARPETNVPIGLIAVWGQSLSLIPAGWEEYVPLKGRMPVGLDASKTYADTLLQYGGADTHTNTIAEMPAHNHPFTSSNSGGTGGGYITTGNADEGPGTFGMQSQGSGTPWDIMNPYRVVHFIQYTGV